MVPTKKTDSNSRTFQDFFSLFPGLFAKVPGLFPDFRCNSRTFHDFYGGARIDAIKFFFVQKNIHPVVYINNSSFYSKSKNKYLF